MEKAEIFVPLIEWFIGASRIFGSYNTYTASIGTDGEKGCFGGKILNYRIWIEKIDEDEYFKYCIYEGMKNFDSRATDDLDIKTLPFMEENRLVIKSEIEKAADEFFGS